MTTEANKRFLDLLAGGEGMQVEFKSTLRFNINTGQYDKKMEFIIMKTLAAFLNTNGGTLFIGVADNKEILGLENDFSTFGNKLDKIDEFQKQLDNLIHSNLGNHIHIYLTIEFPFIEDKQVCIITVKKSDEPVYISEVGQEKLFIKRFASVSELKTSEIHKYITRNWEVKYASSNLIDFETMFDSEDNFKKVMNQVLEDKKSVYYKEVKKHWNYYSLIDDCPFLHNLIEKNLSKSLSFGLLPLIADFTVKHIAEDAHFKALYNQPYIFLHNSNEEDFRLPMFTHIRFIGILYATSILRRVDIEAIGGKNMGSIFSSMIEGMINNLTLKGIDTNKEYPTNYHYLIAEIFSICDNWHETFNEDKYFNANFSYVTYISFNLNWCLEEVYKGIEKGKIREKFAASRLYYGVLTFYFSINTKEEFRDAIEKYVITHLPTKYLKPLLEFAFNEKFALDYASFYNKRYKGVNEKEIEVQSRLRKLLLKQRGY